MDNNKDIKISKAAGKVLLAGGYGVLQQHNYGLSLALNNHFYCICRSYKLKTDTCISVSSSQIDGKWTYLFQNGSLIEKDKKLNTFVQNAIIWTLKFYQCLKQAGKIDLQILFDRNFISDNSSLDQSKYPKYKADYAKTGLGSSACVIISIVQCLIMIFQPLLKEQNKDTFSRLANLIGQIANLSAQKKIGSNFDISTAVYGTHLYKNILPYKISAFLPNIALKQMKQLVTVDPEIIKIKQPEVDLFGYIIDINKSADTRNMVKSFSSELKKQNKQTQDYFFEVSKQISTSLFETLNQFKLQLLSSLQIKCRQINKRHRGLQQKYSKLTGVPIEPEDLTPLIDNFCSVQGVIYAICPGSGGYDAIFVLSVKNIKQKLESFLSSSGSVRPVQIQFCGLMEIKEDEKYQLLTTLKKNQQSWQNV